jgi:hypothetical protein
MLQYQSSKIMVVPRGGIPRVKYINILRLRGSLDSSTELLEFSLRMIHAP